ncbi:acyltransferase family protein [Kocuria sp. cx-455]|uniref:acyltransferase family protein n=1 Tax=Kocuria sp. cx-455 TaxID=2771377 RepID=UPI001CC22F9B|nr:acyltransferase [Kocuria sp. cx-455]
MSDGVQTHSAPTRAAGSAVLAERDLAADAARVGCVIAVVFSHILMVTLTADPDTGELRSVMVPTEQPWYWWATWIVQVMPLFFVVGGVATAGAIRRRRARGAAPAEYVRERTLRLMQPAAVLWLVLAAGAWIALVAGVGEELVTFALSGMGMPLWFLAAYLISQALAPAFLEVHERMGWVWCWFLLSCVVAVDLLRIATDQQWWGLLNMLFVWPLIQHLGFFRADGWFAARRTITLIAIAALCYGLLAVCVISGRYAPDMLTNLNPPTVCMVLLGLAQACVLQVCTPALNRLMRWRVSQAVVVVVGTRAMTIYLWHLPVIILIMAAWFFAGGYDPVPGSGAWWLLRVPLAAVCWAAVLAVATALLRAERAPATPWGALRLTPPAVLIGVICSVIPPLLEIITLLTPALVLWGAAGSVVCIGIMKWGAVPAPRGVR